KLMNQDFFSSSNPQSEIRNPKSERSAIRDPKSRTYRAGTMKEALAQVRRDLGGDAIILGTREIRRRRPFGLGTRELIEVTAAADRSAAVPVSVGPVGKPGQSGEAIRAHFDEELGRLHAIVADLSRQGRLDHLLPDLPTELVPTYAALL